MTHKNIDAEINGPKTECLCPRCRHYHTMKMRWIGRGTPWKFCQACKREVDGYEPAEAQYNRYAAVNRVQQARTA